VEAWAQVAAVGPIPTGRRPSPWPIAKDRREAITAGLAQPRFVIASGAAALVRFASAAENRRRTRTGKRATARPLTDFLDPELEFDMRKHHPQILGLLAFSCGSLAALGADDRAAKEQKPKTGQHAQHMTRVITKTVEVDYLLYLPPDYNKDVQKQWPMILFLHGMGERGSNLEKVKAHGPPRHIAQGQDYPFVIVSPQCPDDAWWDVDVLLALLDAVTESIRVDRNRVYLTGLSMGGYGTWALAARQPERFAAVAPVCGGGKVAAAPRFKELPVWAFHGERDRLVPPEKSREMVDAINKAGGNAKLTVYPEVGHDSWTQTYENPELYNWLLRHRRRTQPQ
jgi:dipeptidyl aminopeptidase/acylaminoacyl peptidase